MNYLKLNVPELGYEAPNKSPFSSSYKSPFGSGTNMTNTPPEQEKQPFNYADNIVIFKSI